MYLVHVWFDQHLSYQGLSISSLVDGGIRPQAVSHHDHVGCLQTLDQHALQRLLQHGGDPCDTLRVHNTNYENITTEYIPEQVNHDHQREN